MKHLREQALRYHRTGRPGKIAISITKPAASQDDLTLAYSPGVAEPVREIYALAGKPVMEGKALLFKRFADVDAYDLEVDTKNPDELVAIVSALEPTFGGINLEDIAAPECFYIEEELRARMGIPVFHDDQHGTAIITGAALLNALEVVGKRLGDVRVVISGAAASATMRRSPRGPMRWPQPGGRISPIRSTTSWAFRLSSAAHWTYGRGDRPHRLQAATGAPPPAGRPIDRGGPGPPAPAAPRAQGHGRLILDARY